MSADNGVYILKTGNQYRVKEQFAIDNLYWNKQTRHIADTIQSKMIVEMFGDCKYTTNAEQAIDIALYIQKKLTVCEYGVVVIDARKSWKQILEEVDDDGRTEELGDTNS